MTLVLTWILEDHERAALASVAHGKFRKGVIAHARRKARFTPELSDHDYQKIAEMIFRRVHAFLKPEQTATYDSYVLMMLVYFIRGIEQVEGPDMRATLQNRRIGINTRARVAYDLTKVFMQELG
ncbi:MAG: hypothetical protein AAF822_09075 [Pseudomonadota bacterium]